MFDVTSYDTILLRFRYYLTLVLTTDGKACRF